MNKLPMNIPGLGQRYIESNGIRMRIAEMGEGPLVLLIHGWPESWYSWRHQMVALAEAGYHVVAPAESLIKFMKGSVPDLWDVILFPKIGHWVQQEAPKRSNKELLKFLNSVK